MNLGMFLDGSRAVRNVAVADVAAGGSIGTAAATVDNYDVAIISQTTANQVLSNPAPTDTSRYKTFRWYNAGSVAIWTTGGRFIPVGSFADFLYVPGTGWKDDQLNRPQTIAQSGTALTCPADTAENTLVTVTFPAGVIGATGRIVVYNNWSCTGSTNTKHTRVRFGGTILGNNSTATAAYVTLLSEATIQNITTGTQVGTGFAGLAQATTGAVPTASIDTTSAQTLTITGQLALGSESLVLKNYSVVLHRQA